MTTVKKNTRKAVPPKPKAIPVPEMPEPTEFRYAASGKVPQLELKGWRISTRNLGDKMAKGHDGMVLMER